MNNNNNNNRLLRKISGLVLLFIWVILSSNTYAASISCPANTDYSSYAVTGTGPFHKAIHWLTWECNGQTFSQGNTYHKSWQLPNDTLIRATIKNITNADIAPYNSGEWTGDSFDENYEGVNPVGLINHVQGQTPKFDVDLSITIAGVSKPVDIVTADAEDTATNERYEWITNGDPWQVIGFATSQYYSEARLNVSFANSGKAIELLGTTGGYAGSVLALSRNISTLKADVKVAGKEALAFGVFLPFDHGDAPSSYGDATHYIRKTATGGAQTSGTFVASALPVATLGLEKNIYLGSQAPDAEGQPEYSSDASTDNAQDDGVTVDGNSLQGISFQPKSTHLVTVTTVGSGYLNAWIDWNKDGDFDDTGEQVAKNRTPQGNKIYLTITPPINASTGDSFARFRFSSQQNLSPTKAATDGEVEDYQITINALPTTPVGVSACPEYIPSANPTAALTAAQVSWDITGVGGTETAILNSFSVSGEPRPFTDIIMPDRVAYQFQHPKSNSQFLQKQKVSTGENILTHDFGIALLNANTDRDITHYLSLDNTIYPSDYVDFYYDSPITSAGNRYILVSERNGNNAMGVEALDRDNQVIGNQAPITPNVTNIDSGIPLMYSQHAFFTIYPLTAIAPAGTKIHGIRLTQTGSPTTGGDGGDGKVFIMVDPVTYTNPPQLEAPTVTAATCESPKASITVNAISNGSTALEYSIDGTNYQDSKVFNNLGAGTYHVKTRYKGYNSCSATYISNPIALTDPTKCTPEVPPLPTDNCAVNYYGWKINFTGGQLDQEHSGTAFIDAGWDFNNQSLPERFTTPDSSGTLDNGSPLTELDTSNSSLTGETFLTITRIERKPNTDTFVDMYDAKNLEHSIYAVIDSQGKLLTRSPNTGEYMSNSRTQRINFKAPSDGIAYVYTWIADFDAKMYTPYALCQDHGDAPNSFADSTHKVGKDLYLGSKPADAELDAGFSSDALGDGEEEDGVTPPLFVQGQTATIPVTVKGDGYLQAWVDFNQDGSFDSNEQIAANEQDSDNNGFIQLRGTVPSSALTGETYARFRWSSVQNLDSAVAAQDGEVEDYRVKVIAPPAEYTGGCSFSGDLWYNSPSKLFNYNINTSQETVKTNLSKIYGDIALSRQGKLYGATFSTPASLDEIDPNTGATNTLVSSTEFGSTNALSVDEFGWLYFGMAFKNKIYRYLPNESLAPELWIDMSLYGIAGSSAGDVVILNDEAFIAWVNGATYQIIKVSNLGSQHEITETTTASILGNMPANIWGLTGNASGKLFAVASSKEVYEITTSPFSTRKVGGALSDFPYGATATTESYGTPCYTHDYGDAPSAYGQVSHTFDSGQLFLGDHIPDTEATQTHSNDASSDGNDEDGATFANFSTSDATYSTTVTATNKLATDALLVGWIDLDNNGTFDPDEAAQVTVPAGSNDASFTLMWDGLNDTGANSTAGATYARLRLSADSQLTANKTSGAVVGGEAEDYALNITSPPAKQIAACTGAWTKSGSNYQSTLSNGITVTASTSIASGGTWSFSPNGNLNTHDAFSDVAVKGNSSLQFVYTWDSTPENSVSPATDIATGQLNFSFSRPVFDPIMHIDRVGGFGNNIPNSALMTLNTANTSLTKLSGFSHLLVNANSIQRQLNSTTLNSGASSESGSDPLLYTAAGSVKIKGEKLNNISFDMSAVGVEGAGADGIEIVLCIDNELDFGDAPKSYGEASHYIESNNMPYLGNKKPDFEAEPAHNISASGDNSQGNNDEDAVGILSNFRFSRSPTSSLINLNTASSRFSLDTLVNNPNTVDAYLAAWIDFDGNGTFDSDELKQVTVPANTQNTTLSVIWNSIPADIKAGASFLRLRITTDPDFASNPSATALAADGESEDYSLTISPGTQTVSGRLFTDGDVDGVYDTGERGMKKVLVAIMGRANDGSAVCIGTLSKADGSFTFKGIKPGSYQVYETGTPSQTCDAALAGTPDGFIATTSMSQNIAVNSSPISDLNFGQVYDASHQNSGEFTAFRKNEQSRITSGEKAQYAHTFIAPSQGTVSFSTHLQGNNWGYLLHHDTNCDRKLSSTEYQSSLPPIAVNADDQICVVATVGSPISAVTGEQSTLTITANFTYANVLSNTTKTATVTDITTIQQGTEKQGAPLSNQDQRRLVLTKTVRNITAGTPASETLNQAAPGDVLEYRIHYYNQTAKDIDHLNIDDAVPEFTALVNNSMTCQTDKPSSLNCTEVVQGDFLQWQFTGVLKSGHKGSVSFRVTID